MKIDDLEMKFKYKGKLIMYKFGTHIKINNKLHEINLDELNILEKKDQFTKLVLELCEGIQ